jgi:antitoxin YefM
MINLTATDARKSFFEVLKQSTLQHELFEVQHKAGKSVIMSADEYESLQETLFLLSQPGFKTTFEQSVREADTGETVPFDRIFGEAQ